MVPLGSTRWSWFGFVFAVRGGLVKRTAGITEHQAHALHCKLLTLGEACRNWDQPGEQLHFSVSHYFTASCHWVGNRHPRAFCKTFFLFLSSSFSLLLTGRLHFHESTSHVTLLCNLIASICKGDADAERFRQSQRYDLDHWIQCILRKVKGKFQNALGCKGSFPII